MMSILKLQFLVNLHLLCVGMIGILAYMKNFIMILIFTEIIFLNINFMFILGSIYLNDLYGQIFPIFVLSVTGAETAIGFTILIAFSNLRGHINISLRPMIRG